jgi:hypothetical protein
LGWDTKAGKWKWKGGRERFVYSEGSTTLISSFFIRSFDKKTNILDKNEHPINFKNYFLQPHQLLLGRTIKN